jgi:hypothetical protein
LPNLRMALSPIFVAGNDPLGLMQGRKEQA